MTIQQHASFDSSAAELNATSKLVKAWESKNAKNAARAGGVSLMALSLAACGGSDSTTTTATDTTTTDTTTTVGGGTFDLTPLVDIASGTQALNGSLASTFRFTDGNETINGMTATMEAGDTLLDGSTTDADVLNVTVTGATTITTSNIETVNLSYAVAGADFTGANTGTTAYNISGSVAGALSTPASGATIALDSYGRVLTVEGVVLTGTTAAGSAETISVALSGATHGSTAASQTGVNIDGTGNDNLEVLNIASNGSAANTFTLSVNNSETIGSIVTSGAADLTIRAAEGLVDGKTIDATGSTGAVNLSFDTASNIVTNVANFSGIDAIMFRDTDTTAADATLNSVSSDQNVVVQNSVGTLTVAAVGATYSNQIAGADLELNGSSATAGVTVTTYAAQNIADLDLVSTGLASSTATTAANTITNLDGDFTTIDITGDTSLAISDLDIEAVETASTTTARAVTVDASAMTGNAFVDITASGDAKVSYTMVGTDNADTLVANASGSSLTGGAGKDTLTGGHGVDVINGGDGVDHIDISNGLDTVTGGAGNDTFDFDTTGSAAVVHVVSVDVEAVSGATITTGGADSLILELNGISYSSVSTGTAHDTNLIDVFIAAHKDAILAQHGVTLAAVDADGADGFKLTGKSDGTTFTADASHGDSGTIDALTEVVTTGSAVKDVSTTMADFAAGDILDVAGILTSTGAYHEGASDGEADGDSIFVLTDVSYTTIENAEDVIDIETTGDDGVVVFLNSTLGHAQMFYNADTTDVSGDLADTVGLVNFTGITNLVDLAAAFSADSFVI